MPCRSPRPHAGPACATCGVRADEGKARCHQPCRDQPRHQGLKKIVPSPSGEGCPKGGLGFGIARDADPHPNPLSQRERGFTIEWGTDAMPTATVATKSPAAQRRRRPRRGEAVDRVRVDRTGQARQVKMKGEMQAKQREPGQGRAAPPGHESAEREGEAQAAVRFGRLAREAARRGHLQPPDRHDDGGRRADGAGLRDHRRRPAQRALQEHADRRQAEHRGRFGPARSDGEVPGAVRRAVPQPGARRRIGRRAGHRAGYGRHLQGTHREHQGQDQEGAVLPGTVHGGGVPGDA